MVLAPERAEISFKADTSTTCLGCRDFKIVDKTTMVDITADDNSAIARFPTIDDADFSAEFVYDPADTGQAKIVASKAAHTLLVYVCTKGSATFTLSAYVEQISFPKGPKDEQAMNVTFAVSGGVAQT